jgi:hypothetical protein
VIGDDPNSLAHQLGGCATEESLLSHGDVIDVRRDCVHSEISEQTNTNLPWLYVNVMLMPCGRRS